MAVTLAARPDLEAAAHDNQGSRKTQNPDFVGVEEGVDRSKSACEQRDPGRRARDRGGDHRQRRQATAERVQADDGRVSQVRMLAGSGAVML